MSKKKNENSEENAGIGHNSGKQKIRSGNVAADQLRSIVERIENLNEEEAAIKADKADVYAEAKGNGFDVKAIRQIVALRKKDPQQREEEETILDTYKRAMGMIPELEDGAED